MIKNIVICDRCGEECRDTTYYTIDIYGRDISPVDEISQSATTFAQNFNTNTSKMFGRERHYCQSCRDKVVEFLKGESKIKLCSVRDTGFDIYRHDADAFRYCPRCGAEMDAQ